MPNGTSNVGDSTVDWNDVAHLLADEVAAKIPVVGWAVQLILDKFWPSDTSSVWDSISDQVQHLVEQSQIAQKINNNSEYIKTLEGTLREYLQEQPPGRGRRLDEAKMQAETLRDQITDLNDIGAQHIHFLPLAVLVSHLHLTILAERNKHGAAVSGIAYDPAWAEELTAARRYYEDYFKQAFKDWWGWRIAQIEQHNGRTYEPAVTPRWDAHGSAKDNLIPYQIYYSDTNNSNSDYYYDVSCAAYRMLVNRARADMAQALSSTFMLHLYDPTTAADPPHLNPDIAFLELGPYCPATLGENGTGSVRIASTDTAGTVIAATIQAGNSVDGLQLHYGGHDGNFSGPGSASGPGRVEVPEHAYCTGFQAHFNDRLMYDIALQYSDGSSTPSYGNAGRWTGKLADATVGSAYALVRAGFAGGSGPSGTSGTEVVLLTYAHSSLINTNGPPGWIERGPIRIKGSGSIPLAGGAPALASNTMGSYAVYESSSGDKTLWFSTVNANGEWSYNAQIVTEDGGTPLTGGAPAMASLRETVYLVYPSSKAGDKSLWFAWGGAAAWFGNRQISIGAGPLANSAPALAKLGNYLFLVYESSANDKSMWLSLFDGRNWLGDLQIVTQDGRIPRTAGSPALCEMAGKLFLIYEAADGDGSMCSCWFDGTAWHGPDPIVTRTGGAPQTGGGISAVSNGATLYLVYSSSADSTLWTSWFDGTYWHGNVQMKDGQGKPLEAAGKPALAMSAGYYGSPFLIFTSPTDKSIRWYSLPVHTLYGAAIP